MRDANLHVFLYVFDLFYTMNCLENLGHTISLESW